MVTFNSWIYAVQRRKYLRERFLHTARQWRQKSLSYALKKWYKFSLDVTSNESLKMQRSKQILNILLNKKRISTQNALRTWINFIWQCRVVDIQMHHNKNVHDLKNRVTHVTTDVRRSVREFRYKTLGSVIYHAKERGQRMAVTKAFYRWSLTSLKEANNELQNQLIIYQNQVGQELSRSESMTHWAINISRIESERYKSKLRKQVAFLNFKQAIIYKRYQNAKLDREIFRQRILSHVSKSISCTVHRHESNKLLKRFCRWKIAIEKSKAGEAEEKTDNLKELLVDAKVDAQNSIVQIVRERLIANENRRFGKKMDDETKFTQ